MSTQYEALNYDGTERRANYRFVSYRIDILHALGKKEAAAIIFEILYRWETDVHCKRLLKEVESRKKAGLPPLTEEEVADQMWTYMSYNDFVRESGSALGYNTVIRMLDYLIEERVIEQRENHDPRYPDYEYRINKEVVRKLLKALPVSPVFAAKVPKKKKGSTQMGTPSDTSTQMGTPAQGSTQMGIGSTHPGIGVYPNGSTSQKDTENSQNERMNGTDGATQRNSSLPSFDPSPSLIANEATQKTIESKATRNASSGPITEPLTPHDPEATRVFNLLCEVFYAIPPEVITEKIKNQCAALAPHVHNAEDLKNLRDYARTQIVDDPSYKKKQVHLGNLVSFVNGWKQEREPLPDKPQDKPKVRKLTYEEKMAQPL
jgi:hypothetical protein